MIDSHCHLDHEPLYEDLVNVINRSKLVGVKKLLTICTTLESFEKIKEIVNKDEIIFGTFGVHPHETNQNKVLSSEIIHQISINKKIIGIGETGLDFYYNHSDKIAQINSFREHIIASIKTNKPLIVHSRNAEVETFDILNDYKKNNLKILMHCFTGSKEFAEKLLTLNSYFSASGIITFKNSTTLQDTFKILPLEKLLIETDSPYLAPIPNRGQKNEPSFIKYTLNKLAELKNINPLEMDIYTTNNFNRLFFN
ncbi:MAG: TatD family deoxyribonuclease [Pelagibacteraceae bacterium]|nr:TatD family deoxyribonuclease [Pelagibacteraceae bacterium]PHX88728.1 MAG: hydrolase TatD [Pelagibacteraceae bacterium]